MHVRIQASQKGIIMVNKTLSYVTMEYGEIFITQIRMENGK